MPQIKPSHLIIIAAAALTLGGCGDKNSLAVFSPESGHQSDWKLAHKTTAKADLETCVECHGENLDGGVSKISCNTCHPASLGGVSKHPLAWGDYAYARHKTFVATSGTSSCANLACHGAALEGVTGSGPACATACHLGGTNQKHPASWVTTAKSDHQTYVYPGGVTTSCKIAACHGTDGKGVFLSGPACDSCHSMK